jgi:hypothetical protein
MNTLWASLVGLILIALAVVLAFNFLQGRQLRVRDAWRQRLAGSVKPQQPEPRPAAHREEPGARSEPPASPAASPGGAPSAAPGAAPMSAERIEPTFGPAAAGDPTSSADAAQHRWDDAPGAVPARGTERGAAAGGPAHRHEPALGVDSGFAPAVMADAFDSAGEDGPPVQAPAMPPMPETGPVLDPRLDCIVAFTLASPVASERLLTTVSTLRRAGSKPVAIEADAGDGRWSIPHASRGAVRRVRAGVLLANRHGPLNAMEFSEFGSAMQSLGGAIGATGTPEPQMAVVLEHARQLDDACARLDAVIGLNIETPTALSPDELAALAGGLGLVERGNNRFAQLGDDGEVLFSLALGDRAELLTLLLDVPRAPEEEAPWGRMVDCARQCADRTGGRLVDDAGRAFTMAAVGEVERQLGQRYRSLQEAGLDAGSTAALRVFN